MGEQSGKLRGFVGCPYRPSCCDGSALSRELVRDDERDDVLDDARDDDGDAAGGHQSGRPPPAVRVTAGSTGSSD